MRPRISLIELMVIAVVFGVLVAILLPALGGRGAAGIQCRQNLQIIGDALRNYAARNNGHLPASEGAMQSLCDQSVGFRDALLDASARIAGGASRRTFYCPSNPAQSPAGLWEHGDTMTTGYIWFNERTGAAAGAVTAPLPARVPPMSYQSRIAAPGHDASELVADAIISDTTGPFARFTAVPGGAMPFASSHLADKRPEGQNVLMTDGGVVQRKFPSDLAHATAIPQGGATVWVVNPE